LKKLSIHDETRQKERILMNNKIIYIHDWLGKGFDIKASYLQQMFPDYEVIAPTIPEDPTEAIDMLCNIMESYEEGYDVCIVGHGLGGYYAERLSSIYKRPSILINPLVDINDMELFLGRNTNYNTGKQYELTFEGIDVLEKFGTMEKRTYDPLVLLNVDDELLDQQKTISKYLNSCIAYDGGNHSFIGIVKSRPFIEEYLESCVL